MTSFMTPNADFYPEKLKKLLMERRVIPFIGSGFSANLSLPTWDKMLEKICTDLDPDCKYKDLTGCGNSQRNGLMSV